MKHVSFRALSIGVLLAALSAPAVSIAAKKNGFDIDDALVPQRSIRAGGPPRDGIPALIRPRFVFAGQADFLTGDDRVLGVSIGDRHRAYPIKIMNYHEIVNDRFGDDSVIVTFCPLCGTGIAFEGTIGASRYTFGVSGLLYNSDVLMYDRQTESLWSQIAGQAITGPMKGTYMQRLPMSHTTWADWRERHPDTQVLSTETGFGRNYDDDPYLGYASSSRLMFPVDNRDRRLPRKSLVLGLELDGQFKAYAFDRLPEGAGRLTDELAGRPIVVEYDLEHQSGRVLDASGEEIPTFTAFWFAWAAFHPETEIFEPAAD